MNTDSAFRRRNEDVGFQHPFDEGRHFFSPELTPLLASDWVRLHIPSSDHETLMIHQLYAYLNFTVRLELGPVNEVAGLLSLPQFLPWLAPVRRGDAIYVIRDESKHAHWSSHLKDRVEQETGIRPIETEPDFLRKLDRLLNQQPPSIAELTRLLFVIVSETLITGSLSRLPRDETVQEAVRAVARAHAKDERQHHTYFRTLFLELWPLMPLQLQVQLGIQLPAMLRAFLSPDRTYMLAVLRQFEDRIPNPERLVDELLKAPATLAGMRDAAGPSLKMFQDAGVFGERVIEEAFVENGFLVQRAEG